MLDKLKSLTPKTKKGNRAYQFHRHLTETGKEALKIVLYSIETLASISENKRKYDKLVQEKYGQKEIPFTDLETLDKPKENLDYLSDFNKKLKQGLNFNPNKNK